MRTAHIQATLIGHYGDDLTVVNAARVSFEKESGYVQFSDDPEDKMLSTPDAKLITYLAKHKHFSPFNHAFLSFRVKAPIFVARQLVKHKFMPWNEVSRRYVDSEPEFFIPDVFRAKADNVKQGSSDEPFPDYYSHDMKAHCRASLNLYHWYLEHKMCPEQARMVLPANMMTEWIWSGTLGAFADMLKLRLDPHTQKESRDVANLIYAQALPLFPVSLAALLENK
ncbi:MAG TPA: FAD-dependent thymidylate synthase [Nitrososphaera sp.]|jgi:thymidylate synthase (FAD)|nr:FAD-dependent thymidylate synthase [Nitrososphaera sp.]